MTGERAGRGSTTRSPGALEIRAAHAPQNAPQKYTVKYPVNEPVSAFYTAFYGAAPYAAPYAAPGAAPGERRGGGGGRVGALPKFQTIWARGSLLGSGQPGWRFPSRSVVLLLTTRQVRWLQ